MADHRRDIDGLRAWAVAAAVMFHAFPAIVPGGFAGVDVFFVISGYLITGILQRDLAQGRFSFGDFYARRLRRLLPSLVVVLVVAMVAGWLVLLPQELGRLGKHLAGAAVFSNNFLLWRESGYFEASAETTPLIHLWSLAVEGQFYLIWPLAMLLLGRFSRKFQLPAVGIALAVSFACGLHLTRSGSSGAYYLPLSRFWELWAGALVALWEVRREGTDAPRKVAQVASWLGIALVVAGFVAIDRNCAFPGWWALLPVCGAALLVGPGRRGGFNTLVLERPAFVWLGAISYPLYLWHWPLLSLARIDRGAAADAGAKMALVAISVLLAWATFRWVETPLRKRRDRWVVPGLVGALGSIGIAGAVAASGLVPSRLASPAVARIEAAQADWSFPGALERVLGRTGFHRLATSRSDITQFLGDSHVQQYAGRLAATARRWPDSSNTALLTARGACPPVPGTRKSTDPGCQEAIEEFYASAKSVQTRSVVVGACWNCYLADTSSAAAGYAILDATGAALPYNTPRGRARVLESLEAALRELKNGRRVYLLLDNPSGAAHDPARLVRGERLFGLEVATPPDSLPRDRAQERLRGELQEVARRAGVEVLDPSGMVCSEGMCLNALPDGTPVYKDDNHLRGSFLTERASFIDRPLFAR